MLRTMTTLAGSSDQHTRVAGCVTAAEAPGGSVAEGKKSDRLWGVTRRGFSDGVAW